MYARPIPPPKRRRPRRRLLISAGLLLLVVIIYTAVVLSQPFASLQPSVAKDKLLITTQAGDLPWPAYGQGAYGLSDGTVIATHGDQTAVPIASAAKIVTALSVLQRHPLVPGQDGPTLTMSSNDVAIYNKYVAAHGSVTPVFSGQKLTERDLLEAMLLPSANNIADTLAVWSFGSVDSYLTYANNFVHKAGLTNTHLSGDASGLSPESTSDTRDLAKLGALAMRNPALAGIVAQPTAAIPGVGTVHNYNTLLGSHNIVGIKTGNNDQNGGVFVGAATTKVDGKTVTFISALSGASNLSQVLRDSDALLTAAQTTFAETNVVRQGAVLGTYRDSSGHLLQAVAAQDLNMKVLRGTRVDATVQLDSISYKIKAGARVGTLHVPDTAYSPAVSVPIVLKQTPAKPGLGYRLLHP